MGLKLQLVLGICLLIAVVHILSVLLGYSVMGLGIEPRNPARIWTIGTAPFVHASFGHLANNLVGLTIFSVLCLVHSRRRYIYNSIFIIVFGGLLVWAFGRQALHLGASGWVFGLWSLCIASAWFERRLINLLIAIVVILFYSGLIYGVLPLNSRVSFESHLFGAVAGFCCAYLNGRRVFGR